MTVHRIGLQAISLARQRVFVSTIRRTWYQLHDSQSHTGHEDATLALC